MATRFMEPANDFGLNHIFKKHYPSLCFLAARITRDDQAAQDIVQDSFIRWWESRCQGRVIESDLAYLHTCVKNAALLFLREKGKQDLVKRNACFFESNMQDSPLHEMIRAEIAGELYAAIQKLPAQCRKVINLAIHEGKTIREVAKALNLTPNAVSKQRTRGVALIRKVLALPGLLLLHFL